MRYGSSVLTIIYMATFEEKFLYKLNLLNRFLNYYSYDQ